MSSKAPALGNRVWDQGEDRLTIASLRAIAPSGSTGRSSEVEQPGMATTLEAEWREDCPEGKGVSAPVPVLLAYVEAWLADTELHLSHAGREDAAAVVR